jgi:hypothetical protein
LQSHLGYLVDGASLAEQSREKSILCGTCGELFSRIACSVTVFMTTLTASFLAIWLNFYFSLRDFYWADKWGKKSLPIAFYSLPVSVFYLCLWDGFTSVITYFCFYQQVSVGLVKLHK